MTLVTPLHPRLPIRPGQPRVPPAIVRGSEALPALHVVEEIPGDLGVVLWRSVRNIILWAHTPAERRAALFDPGAAAARAGEVARLEPEAELLAPLSVVIALLESPERVEVARLVNACRRVAAWAEGQGALGTALEFAQAAALASGDDAALAVAVGRLARRRAEYDRAESWYLRAIVLGRGRRDWRSYALGYLGLGNVHMQKGNFPGARRMLQRSLRAATRRAVPDVKGMAYHDLFLCEVETGAGLEASALAIEAVRAYGPSDPRVARLAYDVAYHWVLLGQFGAALRVAEELAVHPDFGRGGVAERVIALGLVARAAGGGGEMDAFRRAADELDEALARYERVQGDDAARENASGALLGLAYGASSLGMREIAVSSAGRALELARRRRQGRVVLAAEAALEAMERDVVPEPARSESASADGFAATLVQVLQAAPAGVAAG